MIITFDDGAVKEATVGDLLPGGKKIKHVSWSAADILPDRKKFDQYMHAEIQTRLVSQDLVFTLFAK